MSRSHRRPRRSTRLVARHARYDYSQRRTQERQRYDVREYELVDAAWWGWGLDPCMRRRTWTKRLRRKVRELMARYCRWCGVRLLHGCCYRMTCPINMGTEGRRIMARLSI